MKPHESDIELTEHWNLMDPQITAVLAAMTTDLKEGSPAARLYGEALGNALAVYLLNRYAARSYTPVAYRGGLPGYRLKRVLDYIGENLGNDLSLAELAAVVGMGPALFCRLVKKKHRAGSASVRTFTENRACEGRPSPWRAQYYKGGNRHRFPKSKSLCSCVPKDRGYQPLTVQIGSPGSRTI